MKKGLLILLYFLISHGLRAQNLCFKAYDALTKQELTTICVGQQVKFVDCTGTAFDPEKEYFTFGQPLVNRALGPAPGDTINTYTFPQAGTYEVRQIRPALVPGGKTEEIKTFTIIGNPAPAFKTQVCGLNQVNVTITDTNYDFFEVTFEPGVIKILTKGQRFTYTYPSTGTKNITVTGKFNQGSCRSQIAPQQVTTLPVLTPPILDNIKVESVSPTGDLTLSLGNLQKEYFYIIERQSGNSFVLLDTLKNPASPTQTYVVKNINTQNTICFRIRPADKCGSDLGTSNTVCSLPLTSSAANKAVTLTWPPYPESSSLVRYEILRNGQNYRNQQTTSFTDTNINCGKKYQYQVVAVLNKVTSAGQGNVKSFSNFSSQTGISNVPPPGGNLTSSFNPNNTVTIAFKPPGNETVKEITYLKITESNAFGVLGNSASLTFNDVPNLSLSLIPCYQATFQDSCGQVSAPSNTTCPTFLKLTKKENQVELSWSGYTGFASGVKHYEVQKLGAAGAIIKTALATGLTFTDVIADGLEQQLIYRIRVLGNTPGEESFSNTVYLNQESVILVPSAFTPNGDNLNDQFEAKGRFIQSFRMQIFNRWGQIIFTSNALNIGWDGRVNGQEAPVGTYSYSIVAEDINGKKLVKTGTATLLR